MTSRYKQLAFVAFRLLILQDLMLRSYSMLETMEKSSSLSLYHVAFDLQQGSRPDLVKNPFHKNLYDYPGFSSSLGATKESQSLDFSPHPYFENSSPHHPAQAWEIYNSLLSQILEPTSKVLVSPQTVKTPLRDEKLGLFSTPQNFKKVIRKKINLHPEFISNQEVGSEMRSVVQNQKTQANKISSNINFKNILPTDNTHQAVDYTWQQFNLNPVAKGLEPQVKNSQTTVKENFHEILLKKQPQHSEKLSDKNQENPATSSLYSSAPSHNLPFLGHKTLPQETNLLKPKDLIFDPTKKLTGQLSDSNSHLKRKESIRVFGKDIEILPGNQINGAQERYITESGLADAQKASDSNTQEAHNSFKLMGKKIVISSPSSKNNDKVSKSFSTISFVEEDPGSAKTVLPTQDIHSSQNPKTSVNSQPVHPIGSEAFLPYSPTGKEKHLPIEEGNSIAQNNQISSAAQSRTQPGHSGHLEELSEDTSKYAHSGREASDMNKLPPRKRYSKINYLPQPIEVKFTGHLSEELKAAEGHGKLKNINDFGPRPEAKVKGFSGFTTAEEILDFPPGFGGKIFRKKDDQSIAASESKNLESYASEKNNAISTKSRKFGDEKYDKGRTAQLKRKVIVSDDLFAQKITKVSITFCITTDKRLVKRIIE
ncbi:hypothetical protein BY996DRAFT_6453108 [Phakopsora pachyrhizi]|nr:hypothetical protein BY996DRAFT_6453108 [Phakopsora pachyrhizi]